MLEAGDPFYAIRKLQIAVYREGLNNEMMNDLIYYEDLGRGRMCC